MKKRTKFFDIYIVIGNSSCGYWSGGVGRGGRVGWVVGCRVVVGYGAVYGSSRGVKWSRVGGGVKGGGVKVVGWVEMLTSELGLHGHQ